MHNPSTYYERGSQFAGRVKLRFMADFDEAQRNGLVISCGRLWLVVVRVCWAIQLAAMKREDMANTFSNFLRVAFSIGCNR